MFFPPCSKSFRASSEGRRKPILPDTQARRLATPIRPSALPSRAPQPDWPGAFVTLNGSSSFPSIPESLAPEGVVSRPPRRPPAPRHCILNARGDLRSWSCLKHPSPGPDPVHDTLSSVPIAFIKLNLPLLFVHIFLGVSSLSLRPAEVMDRSPGSLVPGVWCPLGQELPSQSLKTANPFGSSRSGVDHSLCFLSMWLLSVPRLT